MKTFDEVLDEVMELDYDSREMLVDIIRKRQIEERRDEILRNVKGTRKEFVEGKLKPMTAKEAIKKLNSRKRT